MFQDRYLAQGAFKYSKQSMVFTNRKFTDWCVEMNYMFAADKK